MLTVPVFVEAWQMDCCGADFSVGDEVNWSLRASPWYTAHLADVCPQWSVHGLVARTGEKTATVTYGGLTVLDELSWPTPKTAKITGVLLHDFHSSEEFPATPGVVRAISAVLDYGPRGTKIREGARTAATAGTGDLLVSLEIRDT
ncbi:hypothetical protein EV193_11482 [Herbihabitans rhizosphaerae]|uniref:Uncharacterized protein n=1 Tax=Herbihabitans rhizosphaerae TaxID=1872711 RepID=A0A4Q7KFQ2_9PSEU|nr:DUF6578 domain-containing protein [Herbihabitans rhizosphaerae]RZS31391.1 hypothetical protein EV193_11482 [Herbihabitans rhizosphaerae]